MRTKVRGVWNIFDIRFAKKFARNHFHSARESFKVQTLEEVLGDKKFLSVKIAKKIREFDRFERVQATILNKGIQEIDDCR